jgi:hypothetical protein
MLALFNELQASAKAAEAAESEAGAEETAQSGSGATSTAPGSAAAALRPDLTCYRAVLQALRPARQWQMASRLIEMPEPHTVLRVVSVPSASSHQSAPCHGCAPLTPSSIT